MTSASRAVRSGLQRVWQSLWPPAEGSRRERQIASCLLVALCVLYLATLYPGVGGRFNHGDSAKFQFIGVILGVSHPPGNPLYLAINALWVRLPLPLTAAEKITLLSAVLGVGTVAFVYRTVRYVGTLSAAVVASASLALGPLFWTLSTEAEVYTLNTFLLAATAFYLTRWWMTGQARALTPALACFLLGLANHLTLLLLAPPGALLLWFGYRRKLVERRSLLFAAAFGLLALSLYSYIPIRILMGAPYSDFEGALNARSLWSYVTAEKFHAALSLPTLDDAIRRRLPDLLAYLQRQWAWPLLALAPLGLWRLYDRAKPLGAFLILAIAGLLAFMALYQIPDAEGFYLPAVTLLSLGLGAAWDTLTAGRSRWILAGVGVAMGVCLASPAALHVSRRVGFQGADTVEAVDEGGTVAWNLPDLFGTLPLGASFGMPCTHYGCYETLSYFRFADPTVRRRGIRIVQLPWRRTGWASPPPVLQTPTAGRPLCTILRGDAARLRALGLQVQEIDRPSRGVAVYCATSGP